MSVYTSKLVINLLIENKQKSIPVFVSPIHPKHLFGLVLPVHSAVDHIQQQ